MARMARGEVWLLFAAVTLSSSAIATSSDDSRSPASPVQFSVHDIDGDGYLGREEYEVFYRDFEERHRQSGQPAHRMLKILGFEQIDFDGDGRISVDEMVFALRMRRQGPGWRWRQ
jgi:Ca2+-binding EF-hand superfamily protein